MSKKSKWKESFQKARSLSQTSLASSMDLRRRSSVMDEVTTDQELQEYFRALKEKSGLKNLWTGDKFLKAVRDEEDKTPDISITNDEDVDELEDITSKSVPDDDGDDDFKPKLMILSRSPSPEDHDVTDSSVNPFQGIQLQLDDLDLGADNVDLNNNTDKKVINESGFTNETKEIKSINNNLSATINSEVDTDDDVVEEIEDDTSLRVSDKINDNIKKNDTAVNYDYSSFASDADNDIESYSERTISRSYSKSRQSSETELFSESERIDPKLHKKKSKHSKSYKKHKGSSSHTLQSGEKSLSKTSSTSMHKSRKYQDDSEHNRLTKDVGVQTIDSTKTYVPTGLGIGMATSSPSLGMQYVDPTPIATHVVASEALEAITAYNPAVIALNDMLRQQIRLVDQFVESNRRMYEAYTRNISSHHRYITLEDTLQYIKQNKPRVITLDEALEEIKRDED